jgi:hypothetical protein
VSRAGTYVQRQERDVGARDAALPRYDVFWQLTHYHHHHVIQKAAYSQNATGENNQIAEQCVLEGSTIWWFAAFLFLLGFSTLDIIVKSTGGPATPPVPPAPSERHKGLSMPKVKYISSPNETRAICQLQLGNSDGLFADVGFHDTNYTRFLNATAAPLGAHWRAALYRPSPGRGSPGHSSLDPAEAARQPLRG